MTVNQPVRHHYLPIFYQSAWAAADGDVTRYYRPYKEVIAKGINPRSTGFEPHLYTLQGVPPELAAYVETHFFKPLDNDAAVASQLLLAGKLHDLTNDQRSNWARFLLSMQLRSPFSLGELQRQLEHVMRPNLEKDDPEFREAMKVGTDLTMYEWLKQNHPLLIDEAHKRFLPGLIDHEDLGGHLINMFWGTISTAKAKHTLLTCDRPLISRHGWKDPQAVIMLPLSPTVFWAATNNEQQMAEVANTPPDKLVKIVNEGIVMMAVDHVYGSSDSHKLFVERRLRKPGQEPIPGPLGKGRPGCPE